MSGLSWDLPYRSQRQPVLAANVIATSQPLAVSAGITTFQRGGNAVDAAIAAAAALTVVEPTSNGIGGDAFALLWHDGALHGINASGRSPAGLDVDRLLAEPSMPAFGWDAVTVPGAVSTWVALSERFGRLDLETLLEPAIRYASTGFPVSPLTASAWERAAEVFGGRQDFAAAFLPGRRAPRPGERFALPEQARTLGAIAGSRGETFYRGELAERIAAHARAEGAALDEQDLAAHAPSWVAPIEVAVGDVAVHELPPNGQGIAALVALGILERSGHRDHVADSADAVHLEAEAMKLAFDDAHRHVADPDTMDVSPTDLLEAGRLDRRAAVVDPRLAGEPGERAPQPGGTVFLVAADEDGTMVSYIQSNYMGFGSGVVVPDTGIALHNRGAGFTTEPGHPNVVAPRKRPFHTIIPGFLTRDGVPLAAFGVMGGPMQPQGHVQLVARMCGWGQNAQAAVDAPRWRVSEGRALDLEKGFDDDVVAELARRGHDVRIRPRWEPGFGGAQVAWRLDDAYLAASDPRRDGHAAGL